MAAPAPGDRARTLAAWWHPWLCPATLRWLARPALVLLVAAWALAPVSAWATADVQERAVSWFAEHRGGAVREALRAAGHAASFGAVGVVGVAAVAAAWWRRGHLELVRLLVVVLGGAMVLVAVVKMTTWQDRPDEALHDALTPAYPSGHAARAAAMFGLLAWYLTRRRGRGVTAAAWTLAATAAVAAGLSRVYLGMHFPGDVIVGSLMGAGWLAAVLVAQRRAGAARSAAPAWPADAAWSGDPAGAADQPRRAASRRPMGE